MNTEELNELKDVVREVVREEIKFLPTREEMGKEFALLREEMQAAFDHQATLIQQEFQNLSKRLSAVETRLANLETRLTKLEDQHKLTSRRLDNIDSAIGGLRTDVRSLRDYVVERNEDTQAELAGMKATVAQLKEEIRQIELRISKLETA